jgi:hypothetical protein
VSSKRLNPNSRLQLAQSRIGSVALCNIPRSKGISEISLDYVEVYALVDHHRNNAPSAGNAYLAFWRHSLERSSGALDVAGAVNVGDGEEPRSQCIVRIKS